MEKEELENLKKIIEDEYINNCNKINELTSKSKIINLNSFKTKFSNWISLFILSCINMLN